MIIIGSLLFISILFSQDIAGDYQLSYVELVHTTHITSDYYDHDYYPIYVTDIHGMYITVLIDTVYIYQLLHERTIGPIDQDSLSETDMFMDITFNSDGTGHLYSSPFLHIFDCPGDENPPPYNDGFTYTSDLETGILTMFNFDTFGVIPDTVTYVDVTGDGIPDSTAMIAGYISQPTETSLELEIHNVIYEEFQFIDPCCEAHTFTIREVPVTNISDECNYNYPIFGDATGLLPEECVGEMSMGTEFYLMDSTFSAWGNFYTMNAILFSATGDSSYYWDDSDHDLSVENSILDGRIIFEFPMYCIPQYEIREMILGFTRVSECSVSGDLNEDFILDVGDIVLTVDCILLNPENDYCQCGDMNMDGVIDVLDIVKMVDVIIGGN